MKRLFTGMTLALLLMASRAFAQEYAASTNFIVEAHTKSFASQVAEKAEQCRYELAVEWLGSPLPGNWSSPCEIRCKQAKGSGGATTFSFVDGEVNGWKMVVQGSESDILNDVIPHEVNHTIFASHFRRPLPRWLDEGAAMLSETPNGVKLYVESLDRPRSFAKTLKLMDYPQDSTVGALYGQSYLMAKFLVERRDKPTYVEFVNDSHVSGYDHAFRENYGFQDTADAERQWLQWHAGQPQRYQRGQATKPELMVFTSPYCNPCKAWKNQYYHNPRFRRAVDGKYRVTFHDENDSYARQYGFTGVPAFVVGGRTIHQGYTDERAWCRGVGIRIGPVGIGGGVVVPPRPFIPRGYDRGPPIQDQPLPRDDIDRVDWNAVTLVLAVRTKIPLFTEKRAANVERIEQRVRQATIDHGVPVNVRVLSRVLDQAAYDQFAYDAGIEESLVNRVHPVLLVPALAGGGLKGFAVGKVASAIESAIEVASPLKVITERDEALRYQKARGALYAYSPDMGDADPNERLGGLSKLDILVMLVVALAVAKLNLLEMIVGFLQGIRNRVRLPRLEWE